MFGTLQYFVIEYKSGIQVFGLKKNISIVDTNDYRIGH